MRSDIAARCSVRRPGWLRHPAIPAESCCLPTLTRFTSGRCAGPGHRTQQRDGNGARLVARLFRLPYTTRTAQSTRSMTPCGTPRAAGTCGCPGPDHNQIRPFRCRDPVIASTGSDRTGCVRTRTRLRRQRSESRQHRFDRLTAEGRDDVDGSARGAGQLGSRRTARAPDSESAAPTTTLSNMSHGCTRHHRPPRPGPRAIGLSPRVRGRDTNHGSFRRHQDRQVGGSGQLLPDVATEPVAGQTATVETHHDQISPEDRGCFGNATHELLVAHAPGGPAHRELVRHAGDPRFTSVTISHRRRDDSSASWMNQTFASKCRAQSLTNTNAIRASSEPSSATRIRRNTSASVHRSGIPCQTPASSAPPRAP